MEKHELIAEFREEAAEHLKYKSIDKEATRLVILGTILMGMLIACLCLNHDWTNGWVGPTSEKEASSMGNIFLLGIISIGVLLTTTYYTHIFRKKVKEEDVEKKIKELIAEEKEELPNKIAQAEQITKDLKERQTVISAL